MAYFLFKRWPERLFHIRRENIIPQNAKVSFELVPVDAENAAWVTELRGDIYREQFQKQLAMGDFGYYACVDGQPVGYGWIKHWGSDDYFFRISEGCCYLCRFFVHERMRGQGIYPALITALMDREQDCHSFYIDVERGNTASERGLKKVGFRFVKEFGFIRGFRHTFNKKVLTDRLTK